MASEPQPRYPAATSVAAAELPHPFGHPPPGAEAPSVSPGALARSLEEDPPPILVDLRRESERRIARIPGDSWIPLSELAARSGEIPSGRRVVLYDHFGEYAARAAAWLRGKAGTPATYLEGGIDAFAALVAPDLGRYPDSPSPTLVIQLPRPDTGCLTYFLGDPSTREAVIIDPGAEAAPYFGRLKTGGWALKGIIETHAHADHLSGHAPLHQRTGAPIYLGARSRAAYPHQTLADGESLEFGALDLAALETPGHTPDHLTLRLEDRIFTGDALLIGSCGRTDLGVGDPRLLYETLHNKYGPLADTTEVYPAHYGPKHALPSKYVSTLGWERATNEAMLIPDLEGFVKYMTEGWPPKPADFEAIVAANLANT